MGIVKKYDVIVIGGGPIGLAAAYHCSKAGKTVLLLEKFNFFNQSGSSNDFVRMFRTMYTQDFMADLAKISIEFWRDMERDAAQQLIQMTGLLNFGDPKYESGPEGNLLSPIKNLERLKMPYSILNARDIMKKYPFKNLPDNFVGIFAPDNGCINVPLVLRTLYSLAMSYGATLVSNAPVVDFEVSESEVRITVSFDKLETFIGSKAVISCGAYTNHVLSHIGLELNLQIWEMVYEYYSSKPSPNGCFFPSMWFQFLDSTLGDPARSNLFYGFPSVPWGPSDMVRVAVDNAVNVIDDPDKRRLVPAENDLQITADYVKNHLIGVDNRANYSGTCLQTNVNDNMYVLDYLPSHIKGSKNVAVFTAGWAFKLVPLIGKILCQLVTEGTTSYDISPFAITRPNIIK